MCIRYPFVATTNNQQNKENLQWENKEKSELEHFQETCIHEKASSVLLQLKFYYADIFIKS